MKILKSISFLIFFIGFIAMAQKTPASPAETVSGKVGNATVTIKYSSPSVKGRAIWGDLVPFDKVWRAGANNATTFENDADLQIENKLLPKGKYTFFVIPGKTESTIIFNKTQEQWGAYKYDAEQDALRVQIKQKAGDESLEKLIYELSENKISLKWEKWSFDLNVK